MANPLIKITNIKRDFPLGNEIVYVLKGIDLEINKGEYVALMGPSGSGKSTLMNILGCLDTPTSGTYILNGKHVSEMQDDELAGIRNKEIGFVFQTFNLMPRTTALDNVALPNFLENKLFFLKKYGVDFNNWIGNIEPNGITAIAPYFILAFILVLFFKNSMEKRDSFKPNYLYLVCTIFLFLISNYFLIGLNSEFLYFNF